MAIPTVMGSEIEFGITVRNDPDFDPISSCVLLVNSYREDPAGEILWLSLIHISEPTRPY